MGYRWWAVDDEGTVLDVVVPKRRNSQAALRLLRKLLPVHGQIYNPFNHRRHLTSRKTLRKFRHQANLEWKLVTASMFQKNLKCGENSLNAVNVAKPSQDRHFLNSKYIGKENKIIKKNIRKNRIACWPGMNLSISPTVIIAGPDDTRKAIKYLILLSRSMDINRSSKS